MKKRLLALLLAVVTVAAMIPAMLISTSAEASEAGNTAPSWGETVAASYGKDLTTGTRATALKHGTDDCFDVYQSSTLIGTYKTIQDAWAAMQPGYTLKLKGNVHATDFAAMGVENSSNNGITQKSYLSVATAGTFTVDGQGYVFDIEVANAKKTQWQYALNFSTNDSANTAAVTVNIKNIAILSDAGVISFGNGGKTNGKKVINLTNAKLYGGNGYYKVDPAYYGDSFVYPTVRYASGTANVPANGYTQHAAIFVNAARWKVSLNGADSVIYGRNSAVRGANMHFTLNNGLVKTDDTMYGNDTSDSAAIFNTAYTNAEIVVNGGRVVNTYIASSGIRTQQGKTVKVNGGEFYTTGSAIHVRSAQAYSEANGENKVTVTVSGGLFVALPAKSGYSATQHNGFFTCNNTVDATNGTPDPTSVQFNIKGGVYFNERPENRAFASTTVTAAIAEFNITGGVFLSKVGASDNLRYLSQSFNGNSVEPVEPTYAVVGGEEILRDDKKTLSYNGTEYYICHEAIANSTSGAPALYDGAQVRLVTDSNGIRFGSKITDYSESNTYGTIIVPADYVINALARYGNYSEQSLINVSKNGKIAKIPATAKGLHKQSDGSYHMYSALTDLSDAMLEMAFLAITYKTVGSTTVYSTPSFINNARSISYVASRALTDTKMAVTTVGDKEYDNPSVYSGDAGMTLYSPYTETQQNNMKLLMPETAAAKVGTDLKASCDNYKAIKVSTSATMSLDLSDYRMVIGADHTFTDAELARITSYFKEATGLDKYIHKDTATKTVTTADKEILIGDTNRAETVAAKAKVDGAGYIVEVTENKIVVWGSDKTYTYAALHYLYLKYFAADEGKATFSRAATFSGSNYLMKELASNTAKNPTAGGNYVAVYDNILDNVMYHNTAASGSYKTDGTGDCPEPNYRPADPDNPGKDTQGNSIKYVPNASTNPRQLDYAVHLCRDLGLKVGEGRKIEYVQNRAKDTDAAKDYEIYMGYVDRADAQAVLASIEVTEYVIYTDGTKIMLLAWNDNGLEKAYARFHEILEANNYAMPQNYAEIVAFTTSWITNFPKPEIEGLKLTETVDTYNSSLEYIYSGTGATAANFKAYCQTLVEAGYMLNNENEIEQSLFRTYYNKTTGSVLHVSYSNYSYATTYGIDNWQKTIRIVSIPVSKAEILNQALLTGVQNQSYTKLTDPMITAMSLNEEATGYIGANYIFTLEDGSFFLVDGGNTKDTATHNRYNEDHMWELLNKLYVRTHGHEPSAEDPIVITGWFLTHYHGDHTGMMKAFCEKYGTREEIVLKYFIANLPSKKETFNATGKSTPKAWYNYVGGNGEGSFYQKGAKFLEVHAGYKFTLVNMEFEVLYTSEDMHPFKLDYENETSVVIKTNIRTTNGAGVIKKSTTFLLTGDMGRYTGQNLVAMYGQYLKSDQMTVAHHGWVGPYVQFYDMVRPHIVWWPANKSDYNAMINGLTNQSDWYHIMEVDPYVAKKLSSVCYIITRDNVQNTSDANIYDYTLVLDQNGIDYKDLRNDMIDGFTGKKITAYETNTFMKGNFTYLEEPEWTDNY